MLGKMLNNRYKIIKKLGKGGMAIVYEAEDVILDRKVAIKMLRPEYVSDEEFIKKFQHEAKSVARISHPNVVSIFDIGQDGDYHYLVMEDIEGENLKNIIQKRGKLPLIEALDITNQICAALNIAHENDIIHCDIKPHNILITPDKQVKVTDFGIARAVTSSTTTTMTDTIMGSANYFSPEQARGGKIKTHSDLYSVGIVLYEMITGKVPFQGDSPISVALKHIKEKPRKPSKINSEIPEKLDKIIMKALAKKPEKRFQKASTMREVLTSVLQDLRRKEKKNTTTVISSDGGDTKVLSKTKIQKQQEKEEIKERKKEKNEKLNWIKWISIIAGILIISGIIAFFIYQYYMEVPIVRVPDIENMKVEEAKEELSQVGLNLVEEDEEVFHPEIPKGNIISQTPNPGERIKQTRPVTVTVSQGPAEITLPDLTGRSLRQAEIIMENQRISKGEVEYEYDSDVPEDHIISQNPEAGEEIEADKEVDLIVSRGVKPNMVKMPNLIGLSREEAQEKLKDSNLQEGEIKEEMTRRFKKDQIAKQEYEAGKEVAEDSEVDLTVSEGLENPEDNKIHTFRVNINMRGFEKQTVKIIVIDDNGEDVVYEKEHKPGEFISQTINSVGHTEVEVYYDDELKHSREIGD